MPAAYSHTEIKGLFRQLGKGDHSAFTELFYHYNQRLYPFVLKKVRQVSIAEELVQDIFLKLWMNREYIGRIENPEGYLYRIGANAVLDHFKKLVHEQKMLKNQLDQSNLNENVSAATLQLKEIESLAKEAAGKLTVQRRLVYQLREDGLSYQEIADKLGVSVNTVKNQLVEASKFIRDYLLQRGITPLLFIHFCLLLKKVLSE